MKDVKNEATSDYTMLTIIGIAIVGFIFYRMWLKIEAALKIHPYLTVSITVISIFSIIAFILGSLLNLRIDRQTEKAITAPEDKAVLLGTNKEGEKIYLKESTRTMHAQVIGTTGSGKTESVILPWAVQDLKNGSGLIIIDGKSDSSFLDRLKEQVKKNNREKDFLLFSLANPEQSSSFNPLASGSPAEIVERVFSAYKVENEYYRAQQYLAFSLLVRLIQSVDQPLNFETLYILLTDDYELRKALKDCKDTQLVGSASSYFNGSKEVEEKISGLIVFCSHFISSEFKKLFNDPKPQVDFSNALDTNKIIYFQLPSMFLPYLAQTTGKMILQCFQSAVSKRHLGKTETKKFFSCYLDDFQDYIYEGFGALLNKARSANIGVVFSHQSLGDLEKVSPSFANVVSVNTNIKVVMRTTEPETAEYFAKTFGTSGTEKTTDRRKRHLLGHQDTGDSSVREVEEYRVHPNAIKTLGTGEGFISIPHSFGVKIERINFRQES
jgi:type IV secretory pathway TraG/TraD family ATPase VirD4